MVYGCSFACSYCIIPFRRGVGHSRPVGEIAHREGGDAAGDEIGEEGRRIVDEVFAAGDRQLREVMVPRTEVEAVEHNATVADVLSIFKEELRERYPVYETSLDNIIGVVSMKQLFEFD